jgi:hypothetical protein
MRLSVMGLHIGSIDFIFSDFFSHDEGIYLHQSDISEDMPFGFMSDMFRFSMGFFVFFYKNPSDQEGFLYFYNYCTSLA